MSNFLSENYDFSENVDSLSEKLIIVKRNSKVSKGGRVFGFSAVTVVGDKKGKIGLGRGKAKEVPFAIQKAMDMAKRNLLNIKINKGTIYHSVSVKYCSTKVVMLPASEGTGIISSHIMRAIFEVVGIRNILVKCFGSKNPNNVINCVMQGLIDMTLSVESHSIRRSFLKKK